MRFQKKKKKASYSTIRLIKKRKSDSISPRDHMVKILCGRTKRIDQLVCAWFSVRHFTLFCFIIHCFSPRKRLFYCRCRETELFLKVNAFLRSKRWVWLFGCFFFCFEREKWSEREELKRDESENLN